MIPFDVTWGEISIVSVIGAALLFIVNKRWNLWQRRRERQRKQTLEWHREVQGLFAEVISVGRRIRKSRTLDEELIQELVPTTVKLDSKVNSPPLWVRLKLSNEVQQHVIAAAGIAYHLAHLPQPDRDEDSVAGMMYHLYEISDLVDAETDVEIGEMIELIGGLDPSGAPDLPEEKVDQILDEFEDESKRRMESWEEMTVDELMELPWEKVDQILSDRDREKLIAKLIDTYYEKALIEKPREARNAIQKSEQAYA